VSQVLCNLRIVLLFASIRVHSRLIFRLFWLRSPYLRKSASIRGSFFRSVAGLDWLLAGGFLSLFAMVAMGSTATSSVSRTDFYVESDPGISIYLREIRDRSTNGKNGPILLVHGARVPGVGSFDLQVPGGSLCEKR
jgi:hypothetical protein